MTWRLSFFAVSAAQAPPLLLGNQQNDMLFARQEAQNLQWLLPLMVEMQQTSSSTCKT
jgi:hypothetical protein